MAIFFPGVFPACVGTGFVRCCPACRGPEQLTTRGAHTRSSRVSPCCCQVQPLPLPSLPSLPSPPPAASPIPCGNSTVYCPAGSSRPTEVSSGNYTLGGTSNAGRTEEEVCPKGRYCHQGVAVLCPPGTFGEREGLDGAGCSGPCPAGEQRGVGAIRTAEAVFKIEEWCGVGVCRLSFAAGRFGGGGSGRGK